MNKPKYTKKILLCIILTICAGYGPTQSQPTLDAQKITQEVGRENPFAKIPRAVKNITPIALQSSEFIEEAPELFVQTIMLKFLDAQSLRQAIGNMSSGNGLIVCDTKEQLEKIVSEIKKADKTPRQIMVEMVIVDVQLNDDTAIGINWDLLTDKVQDMAYRQNFTTRLGTTVEDADTIGDATSFNTTGLGSNLSIINGDIRNVISVLQEKKEVEILASPRIMVVSGKTASIKSVRELSYNAITDTSAGGSMSSTEFKEVGVTMNVTATLTDDDLISLNVSSEQSVVVGASLTDVPIILRRQELTKEINQVPILGDIPIIGLLFRYTNTVVNNTELVIFISPHIYNDEEPIPEDAMEKYREIMDKPMPSIKKTGDDKK